MIRIREWSSPHGIAFLPLFSICFATLLFLLSLECPVILAAKSAQPNQTFMSTGQDSVFVNQSLPGGILLGNDIEPDPADFIFEQCEGTAYLTFNVEYISGGSPFARLTTEVICSCKTISFQDEPENEPIRPRGITAVTMSYCIISARKRNATCDCKPPKKLLPSIGINSANPVVEHIAEAFTLTLSVTGQLAIDGAPRMAALDGILFMVTMCGILFNTKTGLGCTSI